MTWWGKNAVRKNLRPVLNCRNSAETRQENANTIPEEKYREFVKKFGISEEMRPGFQDLMKRVIESDAFIFVPVIDVSQWKQPQGRNRRRAKS